MIGNPQVISTYEAILDLTGEMLNAARNADWDRLIELESACRSLIEVLMLTDKQPLLDDFRERKAQIIRQVLADDAEIRNLTQPWMAQLGHILGSAGNDRKLSQTYDPGNGRF